MPPTLTSRDKTIASSSRRAAPAAPTAGIDAFASIWRRANEESTIGLVLPAKDKRVADVHSHNTEAMIQKTAEDEAVARDEFIRMQKEADQACRSLIKTRR